MDSNLFSIITLTLLIALIFGQVNKSKNYTLTIGDRVFSGFALAILLNQESQFVIFKSLSLVVLIYTLVLAREDILKTLNGLQESDFVLFLTISILITITIYFTSSNVLNEIVLFVVLFTTILVFGLIYLFFMIRKYLNCRKIKPMERYLNSLINSYQQKHLVNLNRKENLEYKAHKNLKSELQRLLDLELIYQKKQNAIEKSDKCDFNLDKEFALTNFGKLITEKLYEDCK